jgi:hypothetical protein
MEKGIPGIGEMKNRRREMENGKWKKTGRAGMETGKGEMENGEFEKIHRRWKKRNLEKEK